LLWDPRIFSPTGAPMSLSDAPASGGEGGLKQYSMHVLLHMCMFENIPLVSWWSDKVIKQKRTSLKNTFYCKMSCTYFHVLCVLLLNITHVPTRGISSHTGSKSWSTTITALTLHGLTETL